MAQINGNSGEQPFNSNLRARLLKCAVIDRNGAILGDISPIARF